MVDPTRSRTRALGQKARDTKAVDHRSRSALDQGRDPFSTAAGYARLDAGHQTGGLRHTPKNCGFSEPPY